MAVVPYGNDVFVTSFPAGKVVPESTGGGEQPHWNKNGRELFYRNGDKMMAVDIITRGSTIEVGAAKVVFEKAAAGYDVVRRAPPPRGVAGVERPTLTSAST